MNNLGTSVQNILAHRMMSGLWVVSWTTQGPFCKIASRMGRSGPMDNDRTVELISTNMDAVMNVEPMCVSYRVMFSF
jgi:hypothetical protein